MTVGQKIRFFRDLRGYTQAELGEKVGLPGDRIRQYETNVRTPKPDKLREIADALDVDVAAISYVDIGFEEDIMQIIFELEDRYMVHMQKIDGKPVLVFENLDEDSSVINTYLNFWYDKRQAFALGNGNEERAKEYIIWRGRFGSHEKAFEEQTNALWQTNRYAKAYEEVRQSVQTSSSRRIHQNIKSIFKKLFNFSKMLFIFYSTVSVNCLFYFSCKLFSTMMLRNVVPSSMFPIKRVSTRILSPCPASTKSFIELPTQ